MRTIRSLGALIVLLAVMACGSGGEEPPPLDEMTLRDALLAEPAVVGKLGVEPRQRLRSRFAVARLQAEPATEVRTAMGAQPMAAQPMDRVLALDAIRFAAGRDALLTATWQSTSSGAQAQPYTTIVAPAPEAPLPPLTGEPGGETLESESRALTGTAGAILEQLLRTTGATKLQRVVAWPIAALAMGDTVYVNGAWLVAMDEHGTGCHSGGGAPATAMPAPAAAGQAGQYMYMTAGSDQSQLQRSGATDEGQLASQAAALDELNQANGSSICDTSGCKAPSCEINLCSKPSCDADDKACCRACTIRGAATRPFTGYGALLWMFAPLFFLLSFEPRGRSAWRSLRGRWARLALRETWRRLASGAWQ